MPHILQRAGMFAFEEKRSKFIGQCEPVMTEAEARAIIGRIRSEHRTASHHVYAYILADDNLIRHSDDGEPQGTAGLPVLNVLIKKDVINAICVVTRYFGGTLLGAGGLVRAYTKAVKGALEESGVEELIPSSLYWIRCPYARWEQVKYYLNSLGVTWEEVRYTEACEASVRVSDVAENAFIKGAYYTYEKVNSI